MWEVIETPGWSNSVRLIEVSNGGESIPVRAIFGRGDFFAQNLIDAKKEAARVAAALNERPTYP
jgi:hypothetical protein